LNFFYELLKKLKPVESRLLEGGFLFHSVLTFLTFLPFFPFLSFLSFLSFKMSVSSVVDTIIDVVRCMPAASRTQEKLVDFLYEITTIPEIAATDMLSVMAEVCDRIMVEKLVIKSVDQLIEMMDDGSITWGDLLIEGPPAPVAHDPAPPMPEDWDLEFPVLTLRKHIWENFPVTCVPLGSGADGAERHAIVWHRKNLTEWREDALSWEEWMDFQKITHYRLMKCLEASNRWTVEPPRRRSDDICVIRMNFAPKDEDAATPVAPPATALPTLPTEDEWITVAAPPPRAAPVHCDLPVLTDPRQIAKYFPIVHNADWMATGVVNIAIHNKKMDEACRAAGRDIRKDITDRLLAALKASKSWTVGSAASARDFCTLRML
jgi:hypothetical protein